MDFKFGIEYWEHSNGFSPVAEFFKELPAEHKKRIGDREDFCEGLSFLELLRTPYFRKAQGAKDTLWELRYPASHGMNYRAICLLWQQRVVVLVMFKGSGSGGKIRHYFQQAIERAEDWKRRYP